MCSFLILPIEVYNKHKQINKILKSRGPDATNIIEFNGYVFVHNLLHICGEKTLQPFVNEEENMIALFNGEIYNYQEFGDYKSDGECLLDLYQKDGEDFIKKLDGEFAIVIFDFKNNKIILSSDIFATKPLFYHIVNNSIYISSLRSPIERILGFNDFKNYRKIDETKKNKDRQGCIMNKLDRSVQNSVRKEKFVKTRSILKTKANETLILNLSNLDIVKKTSVYDFDLSQTKTSFDDWFKAWDNAILKRTKFNNNNIKIGLCLSSGYDSGCIACSLDKQNIKYESYTIKCDETIEIINERIKTHKNYFYELNLVEYIDIREDYKKKIEGSSILIRNGGEIKHYNTIGDWAGVGLHYIFTKARKKDTYIFLSGTGGDEIFSDYGFKGENVKQPGKPGPGTFYGLFPDNLDNIFPWFNFFTGTMESFIAKEEYSGSLSGIEVRYPFLDKDVVQEFLWLSSELKNKNYKSPLDEYMTINKYPFEKNKKLGFKTIHNIKKKN